MTRIQKIIVTGMVAVALSAGAVGIAQAMGGESDAPVADAQKDHAAKAALAVVKRGDVVSIEHDNAGMAAWKVRVFKPMESLDSFSNGARVGHYVAVYLDRDFNWLQARGEGYGPK
jgi:hypothetical protein